VLETNVRLSALVVALASIATVTAVTPLASVAATPLPVASAVVIKDRPAVTDRAVSDVHDPYASPVPAPVAARPSDEVGAYLRVHAARLATARAVVTDVPAPSVAVVQEAAARNTQADALFVSHEHKHEREREPAAAQAPTDANLVTQARAAAAGLPYDWASRGVDFAIGCHPDARCAWGLYDHANRTVWLSRDAFASADRLAYVVAHEVAHVWQWHDGATLRSADLRDWGLTGLDALEKAADCLAARWGHPGAVYWACPDAAKDHMGAVFDAA
jgi:hypothetical protein